MHNTTWTGLSLLTSIIFQIYREHLIWICFFFFFFRSWCRNLAELQIHKLVITTLTKISPQYECLKTQLVNVSECTVAHTSINTSTSSNTSMTLGQKQQRQQQHNRHKTEGRSKKTRSSPKSRMKDRRPPFLGRRYPHSLTCHLVLLASLLTLTLLHSSIDVSD